MDYYVERREVCLYQPCGPPLVPYAYACWILSVVISSLLVWVRMYTRVFLVQKSGWEDCEFERQLWHGNYIY